MSNALSSDARALAGCVWGSAMGSKTRLSYKRGPSSIYPRTLRALRELVSAGVLSEASDAHGAVTFAPLRSCREYLKDVKKGNGIILSAIPE